MAGIFADRSYIVHYYRVLAENSGVKPKEVISKLYAAHSEGKQNMGFDIDGESGEIKVSWELGEWG